MAPSGPLPTGVFLLSLTAFPICYGVNSMVSLSDPSAIALTGVAVLLGLFAAAYVQSQGTASHDPLYYGFAVFAFTGVVDLIIWLEQDGYISGFMEFYMREGEPYLRTSYGIVVCLWDGTVHYLLYLAMASAIIGRRSYRSLGLYWLGSLMMSLLVLLPGNVIGKFGTELRPSFLLNVPYVLLPIWAGMRIFREPRTTVYISPEKALEEQRCGLLQRPLDLALMLYLVIAVGFTLFRGLVVLDCPSDCCFDYIYQYEPYLKDPVAYPKMQMLVYMFYALPVFCLCLYGLVQPGCTWMLDWTLVLAGAIAQAQFSHVGGSLHRRTPYTYRVPAENWWLFLVANVLYALGPHLLAYRCLRNPGFFVSTAPGVQDSDKKQK
ncbi:hypothetical protein NDU88_005850 [Pleurodeles waltl]|uniref:EXPERA domain-containing protein n=2 Tax=Pleurodeles waltl TaxID=8319 RepID=A0AAV7L2G6_PLEWA|nr:hypothetical protein NDU88_005850 [Pleurodeles waltl]